MKKRILALIMTLILLACSAPLTGVAAATAYDRPLAEPIGWSTLPGAPKDTTPYGVAPTLVAATAKQDRTVDYLKILGISQATATKFGQRVRNAITNYKTTVDVSDLNIKVDFRYYKYYNAFWCLMDNEMYYHYNTFMYDRGSYTWEHKNYKVTKIKFNASAFSMTKNEYLHRIDLTRSVIDYLLEGIENNNKLTDTQKALIAHDRLANWTEYDSVNYDKDDLPLESYTAYGLLWNRTGVCLAYAEVYAYLLKRMGIKSRMCHSDQINHIWNIVTLGGKEYYVDVTWDDPSHWNHFGEVNHHNFLVSYNVLKQNHKASDYIKIAQTSTFDTGWPWESVSAPFQLLNNSLYYITKDTANTTNGYYPAILKEWRPSDNTLYAHCNITADVRWGAYNGGWYQDNYSRLSQRNGILYFNTAKKLWQYNPATNQVRTLYTPSVPSNKPNASLYGFTIEWGQFCMNQHDKFPSSSTEIEASKRIVGYDTVTHISIAQAPNKTIYKPGETHAIAGLVVNIHYADGSYEPMTTAYGFSGWDTSTTGVKYVTVSTHGKTTTFPIEVQPTKLGSTKVTVSNTIDGLQVSWKKASGAKRYAIYRSQKKDGKWSSWVKLNTTDGTTYLNKSIKAGIIYRYGICPYNNVATGSIHASSGCRRLTAPSITRANTAAGIYVDWGSVTKATTYSLYRSTKTAGGWSSYTRLTTTSKTYYTDKTAKTGNLYKYAVRANNGDHYSARRACAEIYRLPRVSPSVKKVTDGIRTSWKASSVAEEYVVYRRVNGKTTWTQLATTTELNYVDTTAKKGTYYQYSVRAKKGSSLSGHLASTKVRR